MDRQTKLDVLQKELSRKNLSFGCMIKYGGDIGYIYKEIVKDEIYSYIDIYGHLLDIRFDGVNDGYEGKYNLGHPVILSDVLVWLKGLRIFFQIDGTGMLYIRLLMVDEDFIRTLNRDLTKPYLSEQDDTVVDGLYEVYLLTKKD